MPAVHRATAAGAALVLVCGGTVSSPSSADATYVATTRVPGNAWTSPCGDVAPTGLGSTPRLYWGYGSGSGTTVPDLSGQNAPGTMAGDAARATCAAGASPSLSMGSTTGGGVIEQNQRSYPTDTTVATWFKTSIAGGVIADFGLSNTTTTSSSVDRVLYMKSDGSIVFSNVATQAANVVLSTLTCTSPANLNDGQWHLVVATWSFTTGCTLTVDNGATATTAPSASLTLLSGFNGYWRFGYDSPSASVWPGVTPKFVGNLDESQVYGAVLDATARAKILTRGH